MEQLTIAKPQVEIDEAVRSLVNPLPEKCTIVHCRHYTTEPSGVRIWPETFLITEDGNRHKLVQAFNITLMPEWTFHLVENEFIRFTLVFEGLPKDCRRFYLLEDIPQAGGFYSNFIPRNASDVYTVEVFC